MFFTCITKGIVGKQYQTYSKSNNLTFPEIFYGVQTEAWWYDWLLKQ